MATYFNGWDWDGDGELEYGSAEVMKKDDLMLLHSTLVLPLTQKMKLPLVDL